MPSADGGADGDERRPLKIVLAHFVGEPVEPGDHNFLIGPRHAVSDGDRRFRRVMRQKLRLHVFCQPGAQKDAQRGLVLPKQSKRFARRRFLPIQQRSSTDDPKAP